MKEEASAEWAFAFLWASLDSQPRGGPWESQTLSCSHPIALLSPSTTSILTPLRPIVSF